MSTEELLKDCKKNSLKAQSDLYHRYKNSIYSLCLKYCKNVEDAQDNLQDTFMEIFKNINKYKGNGSFEGWMKRIAINKAIDKYKREKPVNIVINDDLLKDITIDAEEVNLPLISILKLIQELPSQYRLVFNLYELDDYSHKEIAQMLSISESTSKSNLHRSKLILKEKIKAIDKSQSVKKIKHGR